MAPEGEIPEIVLRFIEQSIDTVPQLETLLMMSQAADRAWLVGEVAGRNYVSEPVAAGTLEALVRRSLITGDAAAGFRYGPATAETRELVDALARCYQANLSLVAKLIHSKPSASIKEFARAFDFKKDKT